MTCATLLRAVVRPSPMSRRRAAPLSATRTALSNSSSARACHLDVATLRRFSHLPYRRWALLLTVNVQRAHQLTKVVPVLVYQFQRFIDRAACDNSVCLLLLFFPLEL